jgi:hypothetical protein
MSFGCTEVPSNRLARGISEKVKIKTFIYQIPVKHRKKDSLLSVLFSKAPILLSTISEKGK